MATARNARGKPTSTRQSRSPDVVRYRVAQGTQVRHAGELHQAGELLEAPEATAEAWVASGYVERVEPKKSKT
jgi:hypothetical protein